MLCGQSEELSARVAVVYGEIVENPSYLKKYFNHEPFVCENYCQIPRGMRIK